MEERIWAVCVATVCCSHHHRLLESRLDLLAETLSSVIFQIVQRKLNTTVVLIRILHFLCLSRQSSRRRWWSSRWSESGWSAAPTDNCEVDHDESSLMTLMTMAMVAMIITMVMSTVLMISSTSISPRSITGRWPSAIYLLVNPSSQLGDFWRVEKPLDSKCVVLVGWGADVNWWSHIAVVGPAATSLKALRLCWPWGRTLAEKKSAAFDRFLMI